MKPRCDWLHLRYRRIETLTATDWVCDDCGEVIASIPKARMRGKTPAQLQRIEAQMDMQAGWLVP